MKFEVKKGPEGSLEVETEVIVFLKIIHGSCRQLEAEVEASTEKESKRKTSRKLWKLKTEVTVF